MITILKLITRSVTKNVHYPKLLKVRSCTMTIIGKFKWLSARPPTANALQAHRCPGTWQLFAFHYVFCVVGDNKVLSGNIHYNINRSPTGIQHDKTLR